MESSKDRLSISVSDLNHPVLRQIPILVFTICHSLHRLTIITSPSTANHSSTSSRSYPNEQHAGRSRNRTSPNRLRAHQITQQRDPRVLRTTPELPHASSPASGPRSSIILKQIMWNIFKALISDCWPRAISYAERTPVNVLAPVAPCPISNMLGSYFKAHSNTFLNANSRLVA